MHQLQEHLHINDTGGIYYISDSLHIGYGIYLLIVAVELTEKEREARTKDFSLPSLFSKVCAPQLNVCPHPSTSMRPTESDGGGGIGDRRVHGKKHQRLRLSHRKEKPPLPPQATSSEPVQLSLHQQSLPEDTSKTTHHSPENLSLAGDGGELGMERESTMEARLPSSRLSATTKPLEDNDRLQQPVMDPEKKKVETKKQKKRRLHKLRVARARQRQREEAAREKARRPPKGSFRQIVMGQAHHREKIFYGNKFWAERKRASKRKQQNKSWSGETTSTPLAGLVTVPCEEQGLPSVSNYSASAGSSIGPRPSDDGCIFSEEERVCHMQALVQRRLNRALLDDQQTTDRDGGRGGDDIDKIFSHLE